MGFHMDVPSKIKIDQDEVKTIINYEYLWRVDELWTEHIIGTFSTNYFD